MKICIAYLLWQSLYITKVQTSSLSYHGSNQSNTGNFIEPDRDTYLNYSENYSSSLTYKRTTNSKL